MDKNENLPLQNENCFGCKFCGWDEIKKEERCWIKGCFNNSKFVEFKLTYSKGD